MREKVAGSEARCAAADGTVSTSTAAEADPEPAALEAPVNSADDADAGGGIKRAGPGERRLPRSGV